MRTYGTLTHDPGHHEGPCWRIDVEPHVLMRIKRILPRVRAEQRGAIIVSDTPEVAADIRWIMDRWPLRTGPVARELLAARARAHDDRAAMVDRILTGYQPPLGADVMDMGIDLRDYQADARNLAWTTGALLLADPLGLGKTFSALSTLAKPELLPAAIIVPTILPKQWARSLHAMFPLLRFHIAKTTKPTELDGKDDPDVIILTWSKVPGWAQHLAGRVRSVLLDEAQELRTGEGTARYSSTSWITGEADLVMGLTATPVYNWGVEVWNLMNIISPDTLGTKPEFIREWCSASYADDRKARVNDPAALGTFLREQGVMLRRTRAEVGRELPETPPQIIDIDIDHKAYEAEVSALDVASFARQMLSSTTGFLEKGRAQQEMDWRLRQATGIAKAPYVAAFVSMLLESQEPIVLFGWHRAVYELWSMLLKDHWPAYVTGSETTNQKLAAVDKFLDGETNLLIVSLRSGAGLDGLQKRSKVAVFGELDWAPGIHDQCVGRLRRDGMGPEPVSAYYLVTDEGSDPTILDTLALKRPQNERFVDPQQALFTPKASTEGAMRRLAEQFLKRHGGL